MLDDWKLLQDLGLIPACNSQPVHVIWSLRKVLPTSRKPPRNAKLERNMYILIIPLVTFSQLGTDVAISLRIGECSKNGPVLTFPINRIPSKYRSDQCVQREC